MRAITHVPSPYIDRCELTFVARSRIDYDRACRQHEAYCRMLAECGAVVETLYENSALPDCAFVEDTAIVLDEVAVPASMGASSRGGEIAAIERALSPYRAIRRIEPPATIEGGDVLRVGKSLLVGLSPRTNSAGVEALAEIVGPLGYRVSPVRVGGCLHLKTACTALDEDTLLVNRAWVDVSSLANYRLIDVPASEPWGANVLRMNGGVCLPVAHRETSDVVATLGIDVRTVDLSELAKAEAGITCLGLLIA